MTNEMINIIVGVIFVIGGLVLIIFHKQLASRSIAFHHKLLQLSATKKAIRLWFLLGGIVVLVFGLLFVFQILKFKSI